MNERFEAPSSGVVEAETTMYEPGREPGFFDEEKASGVPNDLTDLYLQQIGKIPLLRAEQEVELAQRIEAGVFAQTVQRVRDPAERATYVEELKDKKWNEEDIELHLKQLDGVQLKATDVELLGRDGERAKTHLEEANLRWVVALAKRKAGRGVPLLDLIQEGNIGLVHAVEKFDYTKGFKFSTYATWWINRYIYRAVEAVDAGALSLEAPIGSADDPITLGECLVDTDAEEVDREYCMAAAAQCVRLAVETLPERDRRLLGLYYGLDGETETSFTELGKRFGKSPRTMRDYLKNARNKLSTREQYLRNAFELLEE